jgi:uncharacterized membrane-anchored protein
MRAHDGETASEEYLLAANLEPQNAVAQLRAASVHLMAGRFPEARTHAEAAIRLAPTTPTRISRSAKRSRRCTSPSTASRSC